MRLQFFRKGPDICLCATDEYKQDFRYSLTRGAEGELGKQNSILFFKDEQWSSYSQQLL